MTDPTLKDVTIVELCTRVSFLDACNASLRKVNHGLTARLTEVERERDEYEGEVEKWRNVQGLFVATMDRLSHGRSQRPELTDFEFAAVMLEQCIDEAFADKTDDDSG